MKRRMKMKIMEDSHNHHMCTPPRPIVNKRRQQPQGQEQPSPKSGISNKQCQDSGERQERDTTTRRTTRTTRIRRTTRNRQRAIRAHRTRRTRRERKQRQTMKDTKRRVKMKSR